MKTKTLFICLVLCFAWQANAQTEFAPINAEWHYNYGSHPTGYFNRIISEKDTIVGGSNCRVLRQYYNNSTIAGEKYIIKQEQGKVYYYYQDQFYLLFDFDAEENDIVEFTFMYRKYDVYDDFPSNYKDTIYAVQFEIENITTNAQGLKIVKARVLNEDIFAFDGTLPNPFENQEYSYTEKIGFYKEFMPVLDNLWVHTTEDQFPFLRCYSDADISFISDSWAATSLPCDYSIYTGLNTPRDAEKIKIYPNPFSDNIFVFTSYKGEIKMIDISGKIIYSSELSTGINEISTCHFPQGIFLVEIKNDDNSMQTFKITKP